MIAGKVSEALDAVVPIRILTPSDSFIDIEAVVDTGFNGTLAISKELAGQMGVEPAGSNEATLADGRIATLQCCKVSVEWRGAPRELAAWIVDKSCLIGMELLLGCRLEIDITPGGEVFVKP